MKRDKKVMIDHHLKGRGIKNSNVLKAFETVDREDFLPIHLAAYAYNDSPLPIDENQTISQPFIVALMVEALNPSKDKTVLEIGTGSGYQTAILAELFNHVYTVEYHETLYLQAKEKLSHYNNITCKLGDGKEGFKDHSPFDTIIVSAAREDLPINFKNQLKNQGRIVMPLGKRMFQELTLIIKDNFNYKHYSLGGCRFVPLL